MRVSALGACLAVALGFLLGTTLPTDARAGACQDQDRTYCVSGNSTGSDWTWAVDTFGASVDASAEGLNNGDPPADIVTVMIDSMTTAGATAQSTLNPDCFLVTSCHRLIIDGSVVTTTPVSFNPDIVQIIPEPGSTAMLAAGALGLGLLNRHRQRREARRARGGEAT